MISELFETIRENAAKDIWSRGVELARQDAVSGDRRTDDEIGLRVFERSRSISTLVTLWPKDADWTKDCSCKIDPCHHVAAAIIALKRAEEQGQELPQTKTAGGTLTYAFSRVEGALHFERYVHYPDGAEPRLLTIPLSQTHRLSEFAVSPTKIDQAVESALQGERRGRLPIGTMTRLLPILQECRVTLDEMPITIQRDPLGLSIEIRDEGLGVRVIGKRDPRIIESFHNGVVLSDNGLHPQVDLTMEPSDRAALLNGKTIPMRDIEQFASEKLPEWKKRFVIDNKAKNLPQFVEAEPELELLLERHGDQMLLMPGIVYGNPPIARIADGVFRPLGNLVPIRDHDEERRLKDQLWRLWGYELYHAKMLAASDAIKAVESLDSWRGKIRGDGVEQFKKSGLLIPKVKWNQGRLEIEFTNEKGSKAPSDQVLRAYNERKSLVPLFGGGFAQLPADWMTRYGSKIMDLMTAQKSGDLPRAAMAQAHELFEDLGIETPTELTIFNRLKDSDWESLPPILPRDMLVTLRPYQAQGVAWLQQMQNLELGALLADDMGLGKTVQAIASLKRHSLIIAPTSVLPNWRRELKRFRPNLKVSLYHGANRQWDEDADVVLTSYGLLRHDLEQLQSRIWETIVLDEAQIIKNADSKVALAAFQLRSNFRIALSGTPVENRLEDLWSIFAFLNPGLLGTKKEFRERWSKPVEEGDNEAAARLRKILKPFVLRRLKSQVAKDLPPRIEKILYSELWPEERKLYEAIYATTRREVVAKLEAGGSIFEALEALLRMRQAACHPSLVPSQSAAHSSKLTLLVESLETALAENHKALVFSQWTGLLDLLEPVLDAAGITFLRLDGSTRDRQSIVDQFQDENGPPVLIMSLKAGGVGLNLTRADHVFILDPWWNPAAADQAADRAHRIGQTNTVMIHPLVALDTVEEKIMELQNAKRALAEASLGEGAATAITRQDILDLLGG
ncbi:MAG: SNF2 helicase associated domain-containing protein [Chitinophagaceae bacterium]|nr:SNF2 helicase associated domain-containing protein [Oligoflexus sp.]